MSLSLLFLFAHCSLSCVAQLSSSQQQLLVGEFVGQSCRGRCPVVVVVGVGVDWGHTNTHAPLTDTLLAWAEHERVSCRLRETDETHKYGHNKYSDRESKVYLPGVAASRKTLDRVEWVEVE